MCSPRTLLGKILRLPLSLIPSEAEVRILRGPLRGRKWIVGAGSNACWVGTYDNSEFLGRARTRKPVVAAVFGICVAPQIPPALLHSVLDGDVGVHRAGGAASGRRLNQDLQRGACRVVLRNRAAVIGRRGNSDVDRCRTVGEPHDCVCRATGWGGFCLHLKARDGE